MASCRTRKRPTSTATTCSSAASSAAARCRPPTPCRTTCYLPPRPTYDNDGSTACAPASTTRSRVRGAASHSQYLDFDGKFQLTDKLSWCRRSSGISTATARRRTRTSPKRSSALTQRDSSSLNGPQQRRQLVAPTPRPPRQAQRRPERPRPTPIRATAGSSATATSRSTTAKSGASSTASTTIEAGPLVDLKFGVRGSSTSAAVGRDRPGPDAVNWGAALRRACGPRNHRFRCIPPASGNYPSNFGSGLNASLPHDALDVLAGPARCLRRPVRQPRPGQPRRLQRRLRPEGKASKPATSRATWKAKVVRQRRPAPRATPRNTSRTTRPHSAAQPGDISSSDFGNFVLITTEHTYNDLLPSANLKLDLTQGHGRCASRRRAR